MEENSPGDEPVGAAHEDDYDIQAGGEAGETTVDLQQQIQNLKSELSEKESELDTQVKEAAQLITKNFKLKKKNDKLKRKNLDLNLEKDKLKKEVERNGEEISAQSKSFTEEMTSLKAALKQTDGGGATGESERVRELESRLAEMQVALQTQGTICADPATGGTDGDDQQTTEIETLRRENESLTVSVKTKEDELAHEKIRTQERIETLKKGSMSDEIKRTLQLYEESFTKLRSQLESSDQRYDRLQTDFTSQMKAMQEATELMSKESGARVEKLADELQACITAAHREYDNLKRRLSKYEDVSSLKLNLSSSRPRPPGKAPPVGRPKRKGSPLPPALPPPPTRKASPKPPSKAAPSNVVRKGSLDRKAPPRPEKFPITYHQRPFGFVIFAKKNGCGAFVENGQRPPPTDDIYMGGAEMMSINDIQVHALPHDDVIRKLKTYKMPITVQYRRCTRPPVLQVPRTQQRKTSGGFDVGFTASMLTTTMTSTFSKLQNNISAGMKNMVESMALNDPQQGSAGASMNRGELSRLQQQLQAANLKITQQSAGYFLERDKLLKQQQMLLQRQELEHGNFERAKERMKDHRLQQEQSIQKLKRQVDDADMETYRLHEENQMMQRQDGDLRTENQQLQDTTARDRAVCNQLDREVASLKEQLGSAKEHSIQNDVAYQRERRRTDDLQEEVNLLKSRTDPQLGPPSVGSHGSADSVATIQQLKRERDWLTNENKELKQKEIDYLNQIRDLKAGDHYTKRSRKTKKQSDEESGAT